MKLKKLVEMNINKICVDDRFQRKMYSKPLVKEIGKVKHCTKGGNTNPNFDSCYGDPTCNDGLTS